MRKNHFRILTGIAFAFQSFSVIAQHTPPSLYGDSINYVRTWSATVPETNTSTLRSKSLQDVKQTTQYLGGLARPVESVTKQGSLATGNSAVDLVTANEYDARGLETYTYGAFAADGTNGNTHISDGLYKNRPFGQFSTFMTSLYNNQSGESYFYTQTNFEASSLARTEKVMAPGNNWVGNSKGVQTKYYLNTSTDDVKKWKVNDVSNSWGTYSCLDINSNPVSYATSTLTKIVTIDEHQNQVIVFKDKYDHVILKKVQLTSYADDGNGKDYNGWLCTYYIYDDIGNLRCVVQPVGVDLLRGHGWDMAWNSNVIMAEKCF